jgi:hypothetical protein
MKEAVVLRTFGSAAEFPGSELDHPCLSKKSRGKVLAGVTPEDCHENFYEVEQSERACKAFRSTTPVLILRWQSMRDLCVLHVKLTIWSV